MNVLLKGIASPPHDYESVKAYLRFTEKFKNEQGVNTEYVKEWGIKSFESSLIQHGHYFCTENLEGGWSKAIHSDVEDLYYSNKERDLHQFNLFPIVRKEKEKVIYVLVLVEHQASYTLSTSKANFDSLKEMEKYMISEKLLPNSESLEFFFKVQSHKECRKTTLDRVEVTFTKSTSIFCDSETMKYEHCSLRSSAMMNFENLNKELGIIEGRHPVVSFLARRDEIAKQYSNVHFGSKNNDMTDSDLYDVEDTSG
ncbi:hypothetical protein AKO1_003167 [Acrasis kona]|uniref:Uncharacterized protein n=1 Tax=Acrasis kona TaxID=1008807 RepID=A0AAW2Z837_9EUKA